MTFKTFLGAAADEVANLQSRVAAMASQFPSNEMYWASLSLADAFAQLNSLRLSQTTHPADDAARVDETSRLSLAAVRPQRPLHPRQLKTTDHFLVVAVRSQGTLNLYQTKTVSCISTVAVRLLRTLHLCTAGCISTVAARLLRTLHLCQLKKNGHIWIVAIWLQWTRHLTNSTTALYGSTKRLTKH